MNSKLQSKLQRSFRIINRYLKTAQCCKYSAATSRTGEFNQRQAITSLENSFSSASINNSILKPTLKRNTALAGLWKSYLQFEESTSGTSNDASEYHEYMYKLAEPYLITSDSIMHSRQATDIGLDESILKMQHIQQTMAKLGIHDLKSGSWSLIIKVMRRDLIGAQATFEKENNLDIISFNAILGLYAQSKLTDASNPITKRKVWALVTKMHSVLPTVQTHELLLLIFARGFGDPKATHKILEKMNLRPREMTFAVMIDAYACCGKQQTVLNKTLHQYKAMNFKPVHKSTLMMNALAKYWVRTGHPAACIRLLAVSKYSTVALSPESIRYILESCVRVELDKQEGLGRTNDYSAGEVMIESILMKRLDSKEYDAEHWHALFRYYMKFGNAGRAKINSVTMMLSDRMGIDFKPSADIAEHLDSFIENQIIL